MQGLNTEDNKQLYVQNIFINENIFSYVAFS